MINTNVRMEFLFFLISEIDAWNTHSNTFLYKVNCLTDIDLSSKHRSMGNKRWKKGMYFFPVSFDCITLCVYKCFCNTQLQPDLLQIATPGIPSCKHESLEIANDAVVKQPLWLLNEPIYWKPEININFQQKAL